MQEVSTRSVHDCKKITYPLLSRELFSSGVSVFVVPNNIWDDWSDIEKDYLSIDEVAYSGENEHLFRLNVNTYSGST